MRRPLIVGNWKMNGTKIGVNSLLTDILLGMELISKAEVAVCPPFPFLALAEQLLKDSILKLGAQNLCTEHNGAYTGEVSAAMLAEFSCNYIICGHSERREYYGETNEIIAKKLNICLNHGMRPIFCLGETLSQREQQLTESVIADQLDTVIKYIGIEPFDHIEIAYEPVWAIGTGMTATPAQAQEVHSFIRQRVAKHDQKIADKLRILYGGSMKASNALELLAQPDIDGGLVGGASLNANDFLLICKAGNDQAA